MTADLPKQPGSSTSFSIGHNVHRREEVDAVMESARRAGAEIVKGAADTFYGGYAGYFRDPTGTSGKSSGTRRCCRRSERPLTAG